MKKSEKFLLIFVPLLGLAIGAFLLSPLADKINIKKSASNSTASKNTNGNTNAVASEPTEVKDEWLYNASAPTLGTKNAKARVVIFSDYLCPYCSDAHDTMNTILEKYKGSVELTHRNLIVHPTADILARGAEAANLQGKFAEMNNAIFKNPPQNEEALVTMATNLGLDAMKFKADLNSDTVNARITQDQQDADSLQLTGTPSVYLNGVSTSAAKLDSAIAELIK